MADREYRQISDLPTGITPITGAEIVELEQDGVSRKFSMVALSGVVAEHEDKHQFGGDDPVGTHDLVANAIPYLDADGTIDSRVSDATETVKGKVLLAADGGTDVGTVVQATDGRLTDARDPTVHASTHMPDSTDPIALATTSAPGLMGNGDKTKLDSIDTSLLLTTAQKGALAGSYGTPGPDNVFVTDNDPRIGGEGPDITDLVNWAAFTDVDMVRQATGQTSRDWQGLAVFNDELYAAVYGGNIYKRDGSGVFQETGQASRYWRGLAVFNDELYATVAGGDIYKMDGSGVFQATGQTSRDWTSLAAFNGELYATASGGDIYKMDGSGVFQATGQSARNWYGLAVFNGELYASVPAGDIYKMDGSGVFQATGQASHYWYGLAVFNDELYATVSGIDIYKMDGSGVFQGTGQAYLNWAGLAAFNDELYATASAGDIYTFSTFTAPSINLTASDGSVNLPSTLPIGSRKVIRKLGDDATKYIGIYPPAGTTIEGSNEYRLYGMGSYITIERTTSALFSIKEYQERSETRSVKDFGAIGDGITDDTASIQAAIDSGVNIYIPEGVYLLSDNLKVNNKTYIHGKGCLLSSVASKASLTIYASDCKIDGIEFDGDDITGCVAVYCEGDGLSVTNCNVHNFEAAGLQFADIGTIKGYFVKNCYIHHCTGRGVYAYGQSEYGLIEGNTFWENNVAFESKSGNNSVIGNNINSNAVGLRYVLGTNDSHSIVSGNNINHNTVYGIDVNGISQSMMTITANHLFNSGCSVASVHINGVTTLRPIIFSHNQIGGPVTLTNNSSIIIWNDNQLIEGPLTVTNTTVDYDRKAVGFQSRTLRYTGTWPASGSVTFAHGITAANIIAVHATVRHSSGTIALPNYTVNAGYHYQVVIISGNVYLQAVDGSNLFNQPYEVYIEYKL